MTNAVAWAAAPVFVAVGWSVVLSVLSSTLVALGLAAWHLARPTAAAREQYRAALSALVAASMLALLAPILLTGLLAVGYAPKEVATPLASARVADSAMPSGQRAGTHVAVAHRRTFVTQGWRTVWPAAMGLVGGAWMLGAGAMLGWLVIASITAQRLRRRSTLIKDDALRQGFERLRTIVRAGPTRLLVSSEIDAPVALGIREPTVLVPAYLLGAMTDDSLTPILVHELAHVARHDYAVHLAQSAVEAVLFHSPAIWWVGRRIREAREFCCDDASVDVVGDRARYVEALSLVARLGATQTRPAVGIAGPRLITRVRRLLEGEPPVSMPLLRTAIVAATFVSVLALLPPAFTSATRHLSTQVLAAAARQDEAAVPIGFPQRQDGSALRLLRVVSTERHVCGTFEVRNEASVLVRRVRFVGVLSFDPGGGRPVQVFESAWLVPSIAAGTTVALDARLIETGVARREAQGGHVQAFCAVRDVEYENGVVTRVVTNPLTLAGRERFTLTRATLAPAFVGQSHAKVSAETTFCVDDAGAEHSRGAQLEIRDQPWRAARCQRDGQWREVQPRTGKPMVEGTAGTVSLEVGLEGVTAIVALHSSIGAVATVQASGGRTWGFVPTESADGTLSVSLHDMSANPHRLVATRPLQPRIAVRFDDVSPVVSVRLASP